VPKSILGWVAEGQGAVRDFAFLTVYDEVDRTANSIKFRLYIAAGLFINVYANVVSGKVGFALIYRNQRIFGRDNQGGAWHLHPVRDPSDHDSSADATRPVSLREFVIAVEGILLDLNLL